MTRKVLAVAIVTAAALALTAASFARTSAPPTLVGVVGPGFTISLKKNGTAVKTLKAGKYTFVIRDKSSQHDYMLKGPNRFKKRFTTVGFVGTKKVTVKLAPGKYKAYCSPHESFMFKRFTVIR